MHKTRREFIGLTAASLALADGVIHKTSSDTGTQHNQILNIYDNIVCNAGDAIPDWGFSAYITYNGKTILFDAGMYPDIIKHNANVLGADLPSVEIAILSHNHLDHINGFDYFLNVNRDFTFYLPNDVHIGGSYGSLTQRDNKYPRGYRYRHIDSHFITKHTEIAPGIHILATKSPIIGTSWGYPPNEDKPLFIGLPELSLALNRQDNTICLISGCSHSKIEEIVKETKHHLDQEISLVIGGFHHIPYSDDYVSTIAIMMRDELGVEQVACSHCTGEKAVKIFKDIYKKNYCAGGLGSRLML